MISSTSYLYQHIIELVALQRKKPKNLGSARSTKKVQKIGRQIVHKLLRFFQKESQKTEGQGPFLQGIVYVLGKIMTLFSSCKIRVSVLAPLLQRNVKRRNKIIYENFVILLLQNVGKVTQLNLVGARDHVYCVSNGQIDIQALLHHTNQRL